MIPRVLKIAAVCIAFIVVGGISAYLTLIVIIKSEDTVVVPDLVGKDIVYALEILTDLGLNTKVKGSEYSAVVPKNHIIFQDPEPGEEKKRGRDVKIIISKGTEAVLMPNIRGLSLPQARIILEENGLCRGELSYTHSDVIEKDDIIAQFPSPGITVRRSECADLLVSKGIRPAAYKMPDLEGFPLEEALVAIEKNNLLLGEIKPLFRRSKPQDVITGQDPPAGHRVIAGRRINLRINRKPTGDKGEYDPGSEGVSLFRHRLGYGFLKRRIRVRLNSYGVSNDVIDDFFRPGEEIWLLIPKGNNATVFLYEEDELIRTQIFNAW